MKLNLAISQGVKVRVMEYEDADIVAVVGTGKVDEITTAVNADRRQKVALVNFRADLSEKIEALQFARKVESVTKDNETSEVPSETEGEHIGRFVDALTTGALTPTGFTLPSGDDKQKETAAYAFLQSLAFQCGDKTTSDNLPCYVLDVNRPVRVSTGKNLLPKWALDAAETIIKNGTQANWATKFSAGYTSGAGIAVDPIVFEDFQQQSHGHHTPEEKEALHKSNVKRLATAIKAARANEDSKRQPEFA